MIDYIGLGSNVGDRHATMRAALEQIEELPASALLKVSSFYETEPVGEVDQPWFLNAVCQLDTDLEPGQVLWNLLRIERALGRVRSERRGPRPIDLDLLLAGDRVIDEPGIQVPHPEITNRAFVLVPLIEIEPQLVHPVTLESMLHHLGRLGSSQTVHRASAEPR